MNHPTNRSMMPATIIPVLVYEDVHAAAHWLCNAFGFVERLRIADHRIQLSFGDANLVVRDGTPSGEGHSIMVRVSDADAHARRAAEHGATITMPPGDQPFGERQYSAVDFAGHRWTFSQTIADVDPATWGGELIDRGDTR